MDWQAEYRRKLCTPQQAVARIPDGSLVVQALIGLAHPKFRAELECEAKGLGYL